MRPHVVGISKLKLEKVEQRLALKIPQTKAQSSDNSRAETRRAKLILGNVGGSHTHGNPPVETALDGWGGRTRTSEWRNQKSPRHFDLAALFLPTEEKSARVASKGYEQISN